MATHYDFPVMTKQEKQIKFYTIEDVDADQHTYTVSHEHYRGDDRFSGSLEQVTLESEFD
jgi:hypothetical protein